MNKNDLLIKINNELMATPEMIKNIQTGEIVVVQHGGYLINYFNEYLILKSSRNGKIYIYDPTKKIIVDEILTFSNNTEKETINLLFDLRDNAIISKEKNKYYLINKNLKRISNFYKKISIILDLNFHLLCKTEENNYVLVDINGKECGEHFKDLMKDHKMFQHWFKNQYDLWGIMEIKNKIKIIEKPIYKSYETVFGGKFKCIDKNGNINII